MLSGDRYARFGILAGLQLALGAALMGAAAWASTSGSSSTQHDQHDIVARVGSATATVAEVEAKVRSMPWFQLAQLGPTPAAIRRAVVDRAVVPELLFAEEARERRLADDPGVRDRLTEALRTARLESLRDEILAHGPSPAEIDDYFQRHRADFDRPERIALYRILCKTRDEAEQTLADAKHAGTLERWNELAREHSVDRATALRGGNLGMVAPDGTSDFALVRADPALVAAASRVADGELVPVPVEEGSRFAVLWRRGSLAAIRRSRAQVEPEIRRLLMREKLETAAKDLVRSLREQAHVEVHPERLDGIDFETAAPMQRAGPSAAAPRGTVRPATRASADPVPVSGPSGLR